MLELLTISRSRKHITNYYNSGNIGKFPAKLPVTTFDPAIDSDSQLLNLRDTLTVLEDLLLAVYTPMKYIKPEYRKTYLEKYQTIHKGKAIFTQVDRDNTTRILRMVNLFKRLESSVYAFDKTLGKMHDRITDYIRLLESKADDTVSEYEYINEDEEPSLAYKLDIKVADLDIGRYLEDLRFDLNIVERLREQTHIILGNSRDKKLSVLKTCILQTVCR